MYKSDILASNIDLFLASIADINELITCSDKYNI